MSKLNAFFMEEVAKTLAANRSASKSLSTNNMEVTLDSMKKPAEKITKRKLVGITFK